MTLRVFIKLFEKEEASRNPLQPKIMRRKKTLLKYTQTTYRNEELYCDGRSVRTENCWCLDEQSPNDVRSTSLAQFYTLFALGRHLNPLCRHIWSLRRTPEALTSRDTSHIALRELLSNLGLRASVLWGSGGGSLSAFFSMSYDALPICWCPHCLPINVCSAN